MWIWFVFPGAFAGKSTSGGFQGGESKKAGTLVWVPAWEGLR